MGFVFLATGLSHKSEWKKNHKKWSELKKPEKNLKLIMIGVLSVLLLVGAVVFMLR